jgi:hypothetical protein
LAYRAKTKGSYGNQHHGKNGFKGAYKYRSVNKMLRDRSENINDLYHRQNFLGTCDRFRQTPEGEEQWQIMMQTKKPIPEKEFLKKVNVKDILDEGETWEEYKDVAKREGSPLEFYASSNGLIFFQTAGFEFIWKDVS